MKWTDAMKPYLSLAVIALLAANLLSTVSLNHNLEQQLSAITNSQTTLQKAVEENQQQISAINNTIVNTLEQQASLFSESSSVVSYSPDGLVVSTKLTPKEYNTDSKITVSCLSDGKTFAKEAVQNGSEFEAICVVPFCESIDINAAITTGEIIEQEPLPSIPCQTVLAFDIYSEYSYSEQLLYISVFNQQNPALLDSLESIHFAILRDGAVIGHIYPTAIESNQLPDSMKGNNSCLAFTADLSQYLALEGDMEVSPRIQSSTGLKYADDSVFRFSCTEDGLDSYESGNYWYPPIFHQ